LIIPATVLRNESKSGAAPSCSLICVITANMSIIPTLPLPVFVRADARRARTEPDVRAAGVLLPILRKRSKAGIGLERHVVLSKMSSADGTQSFSTSRPASELVIVGTFETMGCFSCLAGPQIFSRAASNAAGGIRSSLVTSVKSEAVADELCPLVLELLLVGELESDDALSEMG